jgi:hypothetical protein
MISSRRAELSERFMPPANRIFRLTLHSILIYTYMQ